MESSADLNEFLIFPRSTDDSSFPEPIIDLQSLHVSPRRVHSSPRHGGLNGEVYEPASGGQNSSGSATTSETKKMGKFRFLTNHGATECQPTSESILGGSPNFHEPSSAESCDELYHGGSSSGIPRSRKLRLTPEPLLLLSSSPNGPNTSSRVNSSTMDAMVFSITVPTVPSSSSSSSDTRPRDHDEDLINKHVKRLLKVTEISDNIAEPEENFDEDDDDFDSRLDQMIAEEEQSRKKGRKRTTSKSVMARRRSTRNSRKDDYIEETVVLPPVVVVEKVPVDAPSIPVEPKKRGRKKKVIIVPPLPADEQQPKEEPTDRDTTSVTGKDTSDDAASQMSELKPDSEDLSDPRPGKLKTRWVEQILSVPVEEPPPPVIEDVTSVEQKPPVVGVTVAPVDVSLPSPPAPAADLAAESTYEAIVDCVRLSRHKMRDDREARKMRCDCQYTQEEADYRMKGCTEGCLNRMLYIECGPKCSAKENCSNKRFQRREYAALEIFKTKLKGHGIRAKQQLAAGQFICEYVGEVLDAKQFKKRQKQYADDNIQHHYFMALNNEEVIDATRKGNCSRFTNHSCDPNSETQKWTVAGQLRIGFFTLRPVSPGEEITFDYQFERYGKKAQRCYCGTSLCRGFIGSVSSEDRKKSAKGDISDRKMVSEIEKFVQLGSIRNADQALKIARLMLRVEEDNDRLTLLRVLQNSEDNVEALRAFLRCQGLTIMADLMYVCRNSSPEMKTEILNTLPILPLNSRNCLVETKIWETLEKWAGVSASKLSTAAGMESADGVKPEDAGESAAAPVERNHVLTNGIHSEAVEGPPNNAVDKDLTENPVSRVSPKENDAADAIKKEFDDDSQSQDTVEAQPMEEDLDDVERVQKLAAVVLQLFSDTLKMTFKIPKKLTQDRDPITVEEPTARKSPAKTTFPTAGTTIPTLAPGWCRAKRSPSPGANDIFFRPKQPRFAFPRYDRPFNFFTRRPMAGLFPHQPPFPHHPPFPHLMPRGPGPVGAGLSQPVRTVVPNPLETDAVREAASAAALEEQTRLDLETAAELVSQCLLNNTVSGNRVVSLRLSDGSTHDARTFKPTAAQIELIRQELPAIGSPEWESKAEFVNQRSGLQPKPLDAPVTQEVLGWMANFDLSKHLFLPKDWCAAYDRVGRLYFYNISNGVSRWDFPTEDHVYSTVLHPLSASLSIPADLKDYTTVPAASVDLRPWSPIGDDDDSPRENTVPLRSVSRTSSKSRPERSRAPKSEKSQAALKKRKIDFQNDVCQFVLHLLNAYRSPQCTQGKIETKEDFKYLARKFTHNVLEQEIKRHRDSPEALKFSSKHKPKIKEHVKKYMSRFGRVYKPIGSGEARTKEEENRRNLVDEEDDEDEDEDLEDEEDRETEEIEETSKSVEENGDSAMNGDDRSKDDLMVDDTPQDELLGSGDVARESGGVGVGDGV